MNRNLTLADGLCAVGLIGVVAALALIDPALILLVGGALSVAAGVILHRRQEDQEQTK